MINTFTSEKARVLKDVIIITKQKETKFILFTGSLIPDSPINKVVIKGYDEDISNSEAITLKAGDIVTITVGLEKTHCKDDGKTLCVEGRIFNLSKDKTEPETISEPESVTEQPVYETRDLSCNYG